MDIRERDREVVQITDRTTDDSHAGVNLLLALVLGALIVFLVYLVSSTAISTWYPAQNTEYRVERNTTIMPATPTTAPTADSTTQSQTTETTTTMPESNSIPPQGETNSQ